jgi:hypothetical protein
MAPASSAVSILKSTDCVPIADLAEALRLPPSALIAALEKSRQALNRPFYTIAQLAQRWQCSRATVYNVLRETEAKLLNVSDRANKNGRWSVPASVVDHVEMNRKQTLPEPKIERAA